jgi:uracil-DNA glycosylase family 4
LHPDQLTTGSAYFSLQAAASAAAECRQCGLCDGRKTVVFSSGDPHAELMIIGEAPGRHEDESGLPFVGRAGQLLDKILNSVSISRDDVYICTIVKCRPPQNRMPTVEEIRACKPFLDAQLHHVQPKLILLAGSTAVQAVLQVKDPISRIRGKWFEYKNSARVMAVFNPSYLLRSDSREKGSPRWLMWQDIQEVSRALNALQQK